MGLATVVAVSLTFYLGLWQLSRAHQKEAAQARIEGLGTQPALTLAAAMALAASQSLVDRRLQITGHWLPEHTVLLDNRPLNGKSGFFVFTPLRDAATGQAVMVQRGWVQRDFVDRSRIPTFFTPAEPVFVLGRIARAPPRTFELGAGVATGSPVLTSSSASNSPPFLIRQNLSLPDFQRETRLDLWDQVLVQLDPSPVDGLSRDWPAPKLGTDTHYGYAFQWFGLSALISALFVLFQLVPRLRRRAPSTTSVPPAP